MKKKARRKSESMTQTHKKEMTNKLVSPRETANIFTKKKKTVATDKVYCR